MQKIYTYCSGKRNGEYLNLYLFMPLRKHLNLIIFVASDAQVPIYADTA